MKKISVTFILLLSLLYVNAQMVNAISWTFDSKQNGNEAELIFSANIEEGWHLYDTDLPEGGPIATVFVFEDSTKFEFVGEVQKVPAPIRFFDESFNMEIGYFSHQATFTQKIKLLTDNELDIKGYVLFMSCNDETCAPPREIGFSFVFNKGISSGESSVAPQTGEVAGTSTSGLYGGQALWLFILISVLAGLAATLTPCVFPMIPMTVSFFMRGSGDRSKAVRAGIFFGASIVLIFTLLGALFSFGIFGPNVAGVLSTHWIPNTIFFVLFLVFAISFFGAFEIVLPGSLVNKTDPKADRGGLIGAFFMALTTVIVSFSCTGPFIGALIVQAVQGGGTRPLAGMFFFGLAFAAPFTVLAIFPSALSKLPKSGGWLNAVKVVFAFILLAFALKFLSNIDQVYGLGILSREVYLAIWVVIFFFMGLYLLGKIKFSHDSDLPYLGVGRLLLSIATFSFAIYLATGLFGNPLASISALIPPAGSNTYNAKDTSGTVRSEELCGPAKYADRLHLPHGLQGYFDYEQGLECAMEQGKPALLVFKGHACSNCKKMENTVWANPEALKILTEKYVIIALYTDDRTALPEDEWLTSMVDGEVKKTMGKKNLDLQVSKFNTNSIPFHVIIEPDGTQHTLSVTFKDSEFVDFLNGGIPKKINVY